MKIAECSSCKARILWTRSTNGNAFPLDLEPNAEGTFVLVKRTDEVPLAVSLSKLTDRGVDEMREQGIALYVSHFATCPNATEHRK